MICECTGDQLLPGLLIACVIASVISRTLHRDSDLPPAHCAA
ncbi:hypothetical protein ACLB1M_13305 [Escherichia coli]